MEGGQVHIYFCDRYINAQEIVDHKSICMSGFGWIIVDLRKCHILYQFLSPGGKLFIWWNMEEYKLKVHM